MPVTTDAEFEAALDMHGPDLAGWPPELRADAKAMLVHSDKARVLLEAAVRLDAMLRRPAGDKAPPGLADRIVGKALKTPRQ